VLNDIGCEDVNLIHMVQDSDQGRALVDTVMNVRVLCKAGNVLTSWKHI